MANEVINQHYIPQCVLKHFSNHKNQVVEALLIKNKIYKTNYSQSMSEKHIYEHPSLEINSVEKTFSKIEGYFSKAIENILNTLSLHNEGKVKFEDIQITAEKYMREFIVFYYRSGALLHEFSFMQENENIRIEHLLKNILDSSYIGDLGTTIKKYYTFSIIKSEDKAFLLSDQYLSTAALGIKGRFLNISNRHLGMKDVILLIPLSSEYYIAYCNGQSPNYIYPEKVNTLTISQLKEINKVIINNSYKKCIGLQEFSMKEAMADFENVSPAISLGHYDSGDKVGATLKKEVFFFNIDQQRWKFFNDAKFVKYQHTKRNDKCPCNSSKKYKKCCLYLYQSSMKIMNQLDEVRKNPNTILANEDATNEKGIAEFIPQKGDPRHLKYNLNEILTKKE